jgi:hypothetical protein
VELVEQVVMDQEAEELEDIELHFQVELKQQVYFIQDQVYQ